MGKELCVKRDAGGSVWVTGDAGGWQLIEREDDWGVLVLLGVCRRGLEDGRALVVRGLNGYEATFRGEDALAEAAAWLDGEWRAVVENLHNGGLVMAPAA